MAFRVGDRVEEQARSTESPARAGTIREVVQSDPSPRYRIRWDDGHESVPLPLVRSRVCALVSVLPRRSSLSPLDLYASASECVDPAPPSWNVEEL